MAASAPNTATLTVPTSLYAKCVAAAHMARSTPDELACRILSQYLQSAEEMDELFAEAELTAAMHGLTENDIVDAVHRTRKALSR
ncbi:MAG: hypothetical protein ACP5OR_01080 [Candidatus Dormibacteria bacterium]